MLKLDLIRFSGAKDDTVGLLYIQPSSVPCAFTLEDEYRSLHKKVKGETRIPGGIYEIKFRKVISSMTQRYRDRYAWFLWHLELQNVPGFKFAYIHIGNKEDDTDGCILVGSSCQLNRDENGFVGNSRETFRGFYERISEELARREKVYINVQDLKPEQWEVDKFGPHGPRKPTPMENDDQ